MMRTKPFLQRMIFAAAIAVAALAASPLHAVQPDEILADKALEARARTLSKELRCMVCQNQSIDDSDAPLARDLRILLRERLKAGDSDRAVIDYLVSRYGEFVLLRPRFAWHTALLWLTPLLVLVIGIAVLAAMMRQRRRVSRRGGEGAGLTAQEEARLSELLRGDNS